MDYGFLPVTEILWVFGGYAGYGLSQIHRFDWITRWEKCEKLHWVTRHVTNSEPPGPLHALAPRTARLVRLRIQHRLNDNAMISCRLAFSCFRGVLGTWTVLFSVCSCSFCHIFTPELSILRTWAFYQATDSYTFTGLTLPASSVFHNPRTVVMITDQEAYLIGTCLEGFFYGKISDLCVLTCILAKKSPIIPRFRTLFRNICHVFTMPIEQVQEDNHSFLCSQSSLRSICCYDCKWYGEFRTWSK